MIEASLRGGGFRALLNTLNRRALRKTERDARDAHWRRADLLWPDFAPRWKD
ncbi:hypothetical protein [Croceicoccus sediminis]|uniref:hypothetical protein n=1 Tax=Croceicoccus sediminis TaxID=2571150 RepID=UPI0014784EE1|nr:hypothetical protein [Croceicoccus sediminis]